MPNLNDIAIFVEVAKQRHLGRTAERLGVPASTISRRLRRLERDLGIALLVRTTRSILLTEAGTLYAERCRGLVEQTMDAHCALRDLGLVPSGTLRLCLPDTLTPLSFVDIVRTFSETWPGVDVQLDYSPGSDLSAAPVSFDIALRWGSQPDSDLIARHIATVPYRLYASAGYLRNQRPPASPSDLRGHACLGADVCPELAQWTLHGHGGAVRIATQRRISANNLDGLAGLARAGAGIAPLPEPAAASQPYAGDLIQVLPAWRFESVPLFALLNTRHPPARAQSFLSLLETRLRDDFAAPRAGMAASPLAKLTTML